MQPNELGKIPILEYHVITTDPAREAQFVRLADDMRADLTWLYEHNFHVVSTRELVTNTISAPAGKRPVVLTFDDATTSQFRFITNDKGELVPDPDSAVGTRGVFRHASRFWAHGALRHHPQQLLRLSRKRPDAVLRPEDHVAG